MSIVRKKNRKYSILIWLFKPISLYLCSFGFKLVFVWRARFNRVVLALQFWSVQNSATFLQMSWCFIRRASGPEPGIHLGFFIFNTDWICLEPERYFPSSRTCSTSGLIRRWKLLLYTVIKTKLFSKVLV